MTVVDMMSRIQEIRQMLGFPVAAAASSDFAGVLKSTLDGASASSGTATGDDVVTAAEKYLGVPYRFGGTNPESGLDCSGFVQRAYADLGIKLPRVAKDQAKEGTAVSSLAQAKPGDLLAFNSPVSHIGIYVGDNKMIVAPHTGDHVKIQAVYDKPTAIRRIIPDTVAAPIASSAAVRPAALNSAIPYAGLFQSAAAKHGISPTLLAAVAKVESGYNPNAVSKAGAQGLMQILPSTAASLGINPLDPAQAVDGAARILAGNLKSFDSLPLALAAYNAGGGAVRKYNGIPPYAETQAYVPKVQAAMADLATRGFS
jgi:hypothetical protein